MYIDVGVALVSDRANQHPLTNLIKHVVVGARWRDCLSVFFSFGYQQYEQSILL